jgi:tripartite-type tricarboxylate transporter receptor subunit TctC
MSSDLPSRKILKGRALRRCGTVSRRARVASVVTLVALLASRAHADDIASFYKGKQIIVAIGASPGGGYDLYGRLLSRFFGRYVPGHPTVVPENMPGAGGMHVANYVYGGAPKDGTAIGTFSRTLLTLPLFTSDSVFDPTKFGWLGSVSSDISLCITGKNSPVKQWNDILSQTAVMGGLSPGSDADIYALLYKNLFDAKIKLVSGYPGTTQILLAMERGEVDGLCGYSLSTATSTHPEWFSNRSVNFLLQAGLKKSSALPDVPMALDLTDDPVKEQILRVHLSAQAIAHPFAAPPGIPEDRKAALVNAFNETMKDPDYLEAAKQARIEVDPMTGDEINVLLGQIYATPKDILAKAAQAIAQ